MKTSRREGIISLAFFLCLSMAWPIAAMAARQAASDLGKIIKWDTDSMTFKAMTEGRGDRFGGRLYGVDIVPGEEKAARRLVDKVMPGYGFFHQFAPGQYVVGTKDGRDVIGELVKSGLARVNGSCTIDLCDKWRTISGQGR
jgi:hypothetical protein